VSCYSIITTININNLNSQLLIVLTFNHEKNVNSNVKWKSL
jgi:hypothetical protein